MITAGEVLVLGDDGGGWRQYLDGKSISCGAGLELAERVWKSKRDDYGEVHEWTEWTGRWIRVRYEVEWRTRGGKTMRQPMMYATIGGYSFRAEIDDSHRFRWPEAT